MLWQMGSEAEGEERVFSFAQLGVTLRKSEAVRAKENLGVETEHLINYPSECTDNRIKKVLEIQFPHHTLTLTDLLELNFLPQQPPLPSNPLLLALPAAPRKDVGKKLVLFRSKITRDISQIRGDKKNIAKNVVTAFLNFLREGQEGEACETQVASLRGLIDRTKFNNHLVSLVIASDELRPFFRTFLAASAPAWVQQSKLKNKDIHTEAIELYERLCDERETRSQENEQKERDRMSPENDENEYYFQAPINHDLEDEIKRFN